MATVTENRATHAELGLPSRLPDHTELPESDGTFVKNFQEHPQSILITNSIWPVLEAHHDDAQFAVGQDCGIYWRMIEPPEKGAISPDWFYVPNVPPMLDGTYRRSYVMWQETLAPFLALEFASGTGEEERDQTPITGKFWVYEQAIRVPFYGIFISTTGELEFYHLVDGKYQMIKPNKRKHYPIEPLGIEFGVWKGTYKNVEMPWLRIWDSQGNLLLTGDERAEQEAQRAEQEAQRAEQEAQRAEQEAQRAEQEAQRAEQEAQRAEQEAQRAEQEAQRAEQLALKLRELGIDPDKDLSH